MYAVEGVARYGHGMKREDDGSYALEPRWSGANGIVFEGNRYLGRHLGWPPAPKLDWNAPQFNPLKPDEFDAFLKKHREWIMRLLARPFGEVRLGPEPR